ncbi:MAG: hypothetical protein ACYSUP_08575 [Planctomycetota bacterium]|jgi:hypothetical protein
MADEATGVNNEHVADAQAADATDQSGVKDAQPAIEQGVKENQPATDSKQHEETVPYSRFEEANAAKKAAEDAAAQLQAQLTVLQQQQVPQRQAQPATIYDQTVERLGLKDEVYLSSEQQGQIFNAMFEVIQASQGEAAFLASHPDYAQVVGTADITGKFVPAPPLARAIAKDPTLAQKLSSSPSGKEFAYMIAVNDPEYQASLKANVTPETKAAVDAKKVADASQRQASISAAGTGQGNLDKMAAVQNMTDEQLRDHVDKIIAGAT